MNTDNIRKEVIKKHNSSLGLSRLYAICPSHSVTAYLTYFTHSKMIVGIHVDTGSSRYSGYWKKDDGSKKEVLLDAIYNGYLYRMGLDKFNSERSIVLRINKFVKYIVEDNK